MSELQDRKTSSLIVELVEMIVGGESSGELFPECSTSRMTRTDYWMQLQDIKDEIDRRIGDAK